MHIVSVSVLVIGAGPAGVQCAMALDNQGIKTAIVNKQEIAGGLQNRNPYVSDWIAVAYKQDGASLSENMEKNLNRESLLYFRLSEITEITEIEGLSEKKFMATMHHKTGLITVIYADYIVLATGVRPRTGGLEIQDNFLFGPGKHVNETDFTGKRVAVLGGGDNAFENFAFIYNKNPKIIDLYASKIIARFDLAVHVPKEKVNIGEFTVNQKANTVNNIEYDIFCVFYGWEVNSLPINSVSLKSDHKNRYIVDSLCRTSHQRVFAIGEVNHHPYPSIVQSMSEGMMVSKTIADAMMRKVE